MADTLRGLTALQTIFPENNQNDISPQDLRDFLVSTQLKMVTTTAVNYSATANDATIILDASNTAITCALPSASSYLGKFFAIKAINAGTNKPYITTFIDGAAYTFCSSNDAIVIGNDGTNWKLFGSNIGTVVDATSPSDITMTSAATTTAYNSTITMIKTGIFEANYMAIVAAATSTALEFNTNIGMNIDGTLFWRQRFSELGTTTSPSCFSYNINACLTLSGGLHSITIIAYGAGTGEDYPVNVAVQKLVTIKTY